MPPDMLAMLLMMNGGVPSTGDVNASQDLLFNYLMSPEFGALTGTYDPYLTVDQSGALSPEVGMPITYSALQSEGVLGEIANGLLNGTMSYADALNLAKQAETTEGTTTFGLDGVIQDEVGKMRDEINKYNSQAARSGGSNTDNIYAKAGLPTPDRQWTVADAPMSENVQKRMADIAALERRIASAEERLGDPNSITVEAAGRRGSPSIAAERGPTATKDGREKVGWNLPDEGAEGYGLADVAMEPINLARKLVGADEEKPVEKQMWDMIDPAWMAKKQKLNDQKRMLAYEQGIADAQRLGGVVGRRMAGSTPFADAMQQRLQTLAMLRQFSGM